MSSPADRIQIAELRLKTLGEPREGEPSDYAAKREHYRQMLRDALDEISVAQRLRQPYKDADE